MIAKHVQVFDLMMAIRLAYLSHANFVEKHFPSENSLSLTCDLQEPVNGCVRYKKGEERINCHETSQIQVKISYPICDVHC